MNLTYPTRMAWLTALIAVGLAVLLTPGAGALGTGEALPTSIWSLAWPAGPMWSEGWVTTRIGFPEGGRVLPELLVEGLLLAPVTWLFGATTAWNVLVYLRIAGGALGGALWAVRLGGSPLLGLLIGLCPAVLPGLDEAGAGAMLWIPLSLWVLTAESGGWKRGLIAGLLWATAPGVGLGALLSLGVLWPLPGTPKKTRGWWQEPAVIVAISLWMSLLLAWGWALWDEALWPATAAALRGDSGGLPRAGSLLGGLGWGEGPRWGSLLLLVGLYPVFRRSEPFMGRAAMLVGLGVLMALGPSLTPDTEPLSVNGRQLPLPMMLLVSFPPFSAASELARYGTLAFFGVLVLVARLRVPRWSLAGLGVLLLGPWPGRVKPPTADTSPGPRFYWPIETAALSLWRQTEDGVPVSSTPERGTSRAVSSLVAQPTWGLGTLQDTLSKAGFVTMLVDPDAGHGQATEMATLAGGTRAPVRGAAWLAADMQPHTFSSHSSVPPLPDRAGRLPAAWSETDPDLKPLFDRSLFDQALTWLTLYTSEDGRSWQKLGTGPLAHSMTSLGITVHRDGDQEVLLVTGMVLLPLSLGPKFTPLHSASVVTITTTDLEHFGARFYWLDARLSAVDSQIDSTPAGLTLTTWIRTGALGVNPVALSGVHPVLTAPIRPGTGMMGPPTLRYAASRLADPVMVDGMLYYTEFEPGTIPAVIGAEARGDTFVPVTRLEGLTVPHVWRDGPLWRLLAHGPAGGTLLNVVESQSKDGRTWTPPTPVPGFTDIRQCESPVATRFLGKFVLGCSERSVHLSEIEEAPPVPR